MFSAASIRPCIEGCPAAAIGAHTRDELGISEATAAHPAPGTFERTCGVRRRSVLTVPGPPGSRRGEEGRREYADGNGSCHLLRCFGDGGDGRDRSVIRHREVSYTSLDQVRATDRGFARSR